jgi:hypothetical protein
MEKRKDQIDIYCTVYAKKQYLPILDAVRKKVVAKQSKVLLKG